MLQISHLVGMDAGEAVGVRAGQRAASAAGAWMCELSWAEWPVQSE